MRISARKAIALVVFTSALLGTRPAAAAPQKWPFEFNPSLTADPAGVQQAIAQGDAALPPLAVQSLAPVQVGAVKLWLWPDALALLRSASTSGPGFMTWPTTPTLCSKHAAFVVPSLLANGANAQCTDIEAEIRADLGDLGACSDVELPERYVLGYEPAEVDLAVTGSIEGLIGLAGEALSHHSIPLNVLSADFPEKLRTVIVKLRTSALTKRLAEAKARYGQALNLANQTASCRSPAQLATFKADVDALIGEIDAASARIAKLNADGTAASQQEATCLAAKSRERPALPLPSLTRQEREFIAFWLGGTYWRMRGGGLMPLGSTQGARFYFLQQPFTRIGEMTGAKDGADAAFQIYLGVFEGWGEWMDMGTGGGGGDKYADLVSMTSRGERQVKGAVQLLAQRNYDASLLHAGGVQMGPCYFYSAEKLTDFRYADQSPAPYGAFIEGFTSAGEFCSGATIALGFAKTLLDGKPSGKPALDICQSRKCGDDGCGGSCGTCSDGLACSATGQCEVPDGGASASGDASTAGPSETPNQRPGSANPGVSASPSASNGASGEGCSCRSAGERGGVLPALAALLSVLTAALVRRSRRR